jgi:hypothetical protein
MYMLDGDNAANYPDRQGLGIRGVVRVLADESLEGASGRPRPK